MIDSEFIVLPLALFLLRTLVRDREIGLDLVRAACLRIGCLVVNGTGESGSFMSLFSFELTLVGDVRVRCLLVVLDLLPTNLDRVL